MFFLKLFGENDATSLMLVTFAMYKVGNQHKLSPTSVTNIDVDKSFLDFLNFYLLYRYVFVVGEFFFQLKPLCIRINDSIFVLGSCSCLTDRT